MVQRWKFIFYCWNIIGIFLILLSVPSISCAQSLLPFQLPVWEEKMEMFPCQGCHEDIPVDVVQEGLELEEHTHITVRHGGLRCLDCHNPEDRDLLRTVGHRLVTFSNMAEMCGCCHISDYRDWKKGIHGKLLGFWKGTQQGLQCAECHNVHQPTPFVLKPEDPPRKPAGASSWLSFPWSRDKM